MKSIGIFFLIVLMVAILPYKTEARIGETLKECEVRYGKPLSAEKNEENDIVYIFKKSGLIISVTFYDNTVAVIVFKKENGKEFLLEELLFLLKANADGREWEKTDTEEYRDSWCTEKIFDKSGRIYGRLYALYDKSMDELTIMTSEYEGFITKREYKKQQEKINKNLEKLKNF